MPRSREWDGSEKRVPNEVAASTGTVEHPDPNVQVSATRSGSALAFATNQTGMEITPVLAQLPC